MTEVTIYTDGACSGNPGRGGWAAILRVGGHEKELSGYEAHTTNQRMELTAAVEALKALKYPCRVRLYSDSAYLVNAFRQDWLGRWEKNGWRNAQKEPVENQDLWRELLRLNRLHRIEWLKVAGHADDELNNRCDALARAALNRQSKG
ncbi:MAG: ribonuclease HI [Bacteroidota bacterium]